MDRISSATLSDAELVTALAAAEIDDTDDRQILIDALRARLACLPFDRVMAVLALAVEASEPGDEEAYWLSIEELRGRPPDVVVAACAQWATAADPQLRVAAADVIGKIAEAAAGDLKRLAKTAKPVIEGLLDDSDVGVISAAIAAFCRLCEVPRTATEDAVLLRFETHPDEDVRWRLLYGLLDASTPADIPVLIRLTADPVTRIRDWATFSLGTLAEADTPDVRAALLARLDDADEDTRAEAMRGLALRQDRRAVTAIRRDLDMDEVGDLVIEAAGIMPDASFLAPLETLLQDMPDDEDVLAAIEACRTGVPSPRWCPED